MSVSFTHYRELLVRYLRPHRGRMALLALLLGGSITLQLVNPQIIRFFIDTAQAGGAQAALLLAALAFLGVALLQQASSLAAVYLGEQIGSGPGDDTARTRHAGRPAQRAQRPVHHPGRLAPARPAARSRPGGCAQRRADRRGGTLDELLMRSAEMQRLWAGDRNG